MFPPLPQHSALLCSPVAYMRVSWFTRVFGVPTPLFPIPSWRVFGPLASTTVIHSFPPHSFYWSGHSSHPPSIFFTLTSPPTILDKLLAEVLACSWLPCLLIILPSIATAQSPPRTARSFATFALGGLGICAGLGSFSIIFLSLGSFGSGFSGIGRTLSG